MKGRVEIETTYPHPPERVWRALTDQNAIQKWLMPNDFEPLIGYRFRLKLAGGGKINGKVTDIEENRLLAYTWNDDEGHESIVVWRLDPVDGGTHVRLEHLPLDEPVVTRLPIDNYFNWAYALRHGLPGLLRLIQAAEADLPRAPIVYACTAILAGG